MADDHFHFVYIFMNDGTDFTQTLVGIKAKRKLLQATNDIFAYLKDNIKARVVLLYIRKYIAAAFYQ